MKLLIFQKRVFTFLFTNHIIAAHIIVIVANSWFNAAFFL